MDETKILQRVYEHCDYVASYGKEVMFTALFGSQNYGMSSENSDVDTRTMFAPSFKDLVDGKGPNATTYYLGDEAANAHDFRDMFKNYYKGAPNFLETLFTPYVTVKTIWYKDCYRALYTHRELIARMNPTSVVHSTAGHAYNMVSVALKTHKPKAAAHAFRLFDMLERYIKDKESYEKILFFPSNLDMLNEVKNGEWKDSYVRLLEATRAKVDDIVTNYKGAENKSAVEFMNALKEDLMKKVMRKYV